MIKIDSSYDVILTYSPICEITGHIFECFDYYLFLRKFYKVGILFFNGLSDKELEISFNSKYKENFNDIKKDFIHIILDKNLKNYNSILFGKNTFVLLVDGNIKSLNYHKIILVTDHLFGFLCEYDEFEKQTFNKNITYLADKRIYSNLKYFKSIDYVKKIPFNFYKEINCSCQNTGMMYTTYVCRKITPKVVEEYHIKSGCSQTLLIVPFLLDEYSQIDGVIQILAPVENLFDKFNTYIYTPVQRQFDCSPRLISECFFYNKNIIVDLPYVDIGLQTRYNDCKNNFKSIYLNIDDNILNIIHNEIDS